MYNFKLIIRGVIAIFILFVLDVNPAVGENKKFDAIFVWTTNNTYDCYYYTESPKIVLSGDEVSVFIENYKIQTITLGQSAVKVTYGVYEMPSDLNITFYDDADNMPVIKHYNNLTASKVTLNGRSFDIDGVWNSLCLPFDVFKIGDFADVQIMELDVDGYYDYQGIRYDDYMDDRKRTGFDASNGTLYLFFREVNYISAGVPCIIKWDKTSSFITPDFYGATITGDISRTIVSKDNVLTFIGTYKPVELSKEDKSVLYWGNDNTLHYPSDNIKEVVNSFRAYFMLNELELGDTSNSIRTIVLNVDDDITDDTTTIPVVIVKEDVGFGVCYDLNGRRIYGTPTVKGVYIINGKKELVK